MKRLRNCMVALLMGLSAPVLIWVGAGAALYQSRKEVSLLKHAISDLACSIDADCPPGYTCVNGHCVPVK